MKMRQRPLSSYTPPFLICCIKLEDFLAVVLSESGAYKPGFQAQIEPHFKILACRQKNKLPIHSHLIGYHDSNVARVGGVCEAANSCNNQTMFLVVTKYRLCFVR